VEEARKLAARRVRVIFAKDVNLTPDLPQGNQIVEISPRVWNLKIIGPLGPLLRVLAALPVEDIEVEKPRLEEVVMEYYRDGAE
jgi:hypothetical protein